MKRLFSLLIVAVLLTGLIAAAFPASAAQGINLPEGCTPSWAASAQNLILFIALQSDTATGYLPAKLYDGNINAYEQKKYTNNIAPAGSEEAPHKCWSGLTGELEADAVKGQTTSPDLIKEEIKLADGNKAEYVYWYNIYLDGVCELYGLTFYTNAYKTGILDHSFDILVSKDEGETWTKIIAADDPFDPASKYHYEGTWDYTYTTPTADQMKAEGHSSESEALGYFFVDFTTDSEIGDLTGITNVAYGCVLPRCNHSEYTARYNEMEIYGKFLSVPTTAPEQTTQAPVETTADAITAPQTSAESTSDVTSSNSPESSATVTAPAPEATTAAPSSEKKGCGSSAAFTVLAVISCALPIAFRKKH